MKPTLKSPLWPLLLLALSGVQCSKSSTPSVAPPLDPCQGDRPGSPCFTTRIMCIGDSNTQGVQGHVSYRYPLWFEMVASEARIDFVGTRFMVLDEDGSTIPLPLDYPDYYTAFDRDHEGYDGLRTDQVLPLIPPVVSDQTPDVCVIMLGTNDIGQRGSFGINKGVQSMEQIVQAVRSQAPATMFLIATIPPIGEGFWYFDNAEHVAGYNSLLAASVPGWSTPESPAILVDVHAVIDLSSDMLADGVHMNRLGQAKVANVVQDALIATLDGGLLPPALLPANVQEPSFETLGLADLEHSTLPLMDWSYPNLDNLVVGTFNPGEDSYTGAQGSQLPVGADGDEVLSMENNGGDPGLGWVHQVLPTTLHADQTYTLRFAVGQRLPGNSRGTTAFGGYEVQLLAGNRVIASSINQVTPIPGRFATDTLIVQTNALDSAPLGSPLSVRVRLTWSDAMSATDLDWVRLSVQ